jgi:dienelactone hydrolase
MARALVAAAALPLLAAGCGGGSKPTQTSDQGRHEGQVDVRTVTYKTAFDGTDVTGLVASPRGVHSRGCVIWQFGFRSRKEDSQYAWQGLASLGLTTFSIDFRFHGARAAFPNEQDEILKDRGKFLEMVRGTVADLRSATDYLEKQPYCAKNVSYVGVSMGGAIGTIVAAEDKRLKAVALVVTPGTWSEVRNPTPPKGLSSVDPDRYIAKIAPRPLILLNGRSDQTVSLANARKLQAAARGPKTVIDFNGTHDPWAGAVGLQNADKVSSFLLRTVVEPTYGIHGKKPDATFLER